MHEFSIFVLPYTFQSLMQIPLMWKVDRKHLTFNQVLEKHSKGENSRVAQGTDKSRGREGEIAMN